MLGHLGHPHDAELAELGLGYRVPAAVLDWANHLLVEAAPGVRPARSVRTGGRPPVIRTAIDADGLVAEARAAAAELVARYGSVGLVAPDDLLDGLVSVPGAQVVGPSEAKGLEFDGVVVVEPAAIVDGAPSRPSGLRLLYVALTRAVQELTVVHQRPLPDALQAQR